MKLTIKCYSLILQVALSAHTIFAFIDFHKLSFLTFKQKTFKSNIHHDESNICPTKLSSTKLCYKNTTLDHDGNEESSDEKSLFWGGEPLWVKKEMNDGVWTTSLTERCEKIQYENCIHKWFQAECETSIQCAIDDAIRKLAWDPDAPWLVCGSASGTLYLCNLIDGEIFDRREAVHNDNVKNDEKEYLKKMMCGNFDEGSAVVDIAMRGNLVVSCGREDENELKLWRIEDDFDEMLLWSVEDAKRLVPVGKLSLPSGALATKLHFDSNMNLYTVSSDGCVRIWTKESLLQCSIENDSTSPSYIVDLCSEADTNFDQSMKATAILDISISEELGIGACATASGSVVLFKLPSTKIDSNDLHEGERPFVISKIRGVLRPNVHMRSILIVESGDYLNAHHDKSQNYQESLEGFKINDGEPNKWSIICGGGDGSLHRITLNLDDENDDETEILKQGNTINGNSSDEYSCKVNLSEPFVLDKNIDVMNDKLSPSHTGPVMCLVSPAPGIFLSGAQDGTIRIWDCTLDANLQNSRRRRKSKKDEPIDLSIPKCRYALFGYKLWLGSICTSGSSFISDGSDNKIVMRDFSVANILEED